MRGWAMLFFGGWCLAASAGTLAQFRTVYGDFPVELLDEAKPVTVRNFVMLIRAGAFQNSFFHRCVPGFVVQGGGFRVSDPANTSLVSHISSVPNFGPITNEYAVGPQVSNVFGTLAMAKTASGPDTATSQWFFNLGNNANNLDNQNGGFTVFGRLIGPTNLLHQTFNLRGPNAGIVNQGGVFSTLPVRYIGSQAPHYNELIYVDITLLRVSVTREESGTTVAWDSVDGLTNWVEYTEGFPPDWQTLTTVVGNGTRSTATDTNSRASRFYRVRIAGDHPL